MKVVAFAASSSSRSINKKLAQYAAEQIPGAEVDLLDLNDFELPLYSEDREREMGQPQLALDFLARIKAAKVVVISFAEHNGSYAAAYKSLFDWCSRIDRNVYCNKQMILLATSPGGHGGVSVLTQAAGSMPYFGGKVVGSLSVPSFHDNFVEGKLVNTSLQQELMEIIQQIES